MMAINDNATMFKQYMIIIMVSLFLLGLVVNVNPETERIIVTLIDRDTEEDRTNKPTLVN